MFKKALLYSALAATLAGTAGLANAAPRSADPFTDGARATSHDGYVDRKRDVYSEGAHDVRSKRDPYSDGAFSATGKRDTFSDGA
ncbi:copper resistance protein CopQ [Cupriavidus pauculus]|jgi:hypothetical protein|uniref:copper resistance protein CopQ n=1 Tax=Cupriavidus pauculus TaxID=82633 RepID=UPI003857922E